MEASNIKDKFETDIKQTKDKTGIIEEQTDKNMSIKKLMHTAIGWKENYTTPMATNPRSLLKAGRCSILLTLWRTMIIVLKSLN